MRTKLFLVHYENERGERLMCAMRAFSPAMVERFMAPNEVLNIALLDENDLEVASGNPRVPDTGSFGDGEPDSGVHSLGADQ